MEIKFESTFVKAIKKYSSIKKQVKKKVDMIIENPVTVGELLKHKWQGFYSCPVKRIYLYCAICRKKKDDTVVLCSDCKDTQDEILKFILLGPHDKTYGIKLS